MPGEDTDLAYSSEESATADSAKIAAWSQMLGSRTTQAQLDSSCAVADQKLIDVET